MTLHKKICLFLVLFLMMACNMPRAVIGLATQPNPDSAMMGTMVAQTLTAYPSNSLLTIPTSTPAILETPPAASATPLPGRPEYQPGELVDYTAQSGVTLPTFPGGSMTVQSLSIPVINNSAEDNNRTFIVTLSGATGGAAIGTGTATVLIEDDDTKESGGGGGGCLPAAGAGLGMLGLAAAALVFRRRA